MLVEVLFLRIGVFYHDGDVVELVDMGPARARGPRPGPAPRIFLQPCSRVVAELYEFLTADTDSVDNNN